MFVALLLFQSNLYVVIARGKRPKNSVHRDLLKTRNSKQKTPRPPAAFYEPIVHGQVSSLTDFLKCLKNVIFAEFLVNTLSHYALSIKTERFPIALRELTGLC